MAEEGLAVGEPVERGVGRADGREVTGVGDGVAEAEHALEAAAAAIVAGRQPVIATCSRLDGGGGGGIRRAEEKKEQEHHRRHRRREGERPERSHHIISISIYVV